MGISIKAENVSKVYQLGSIGTGTISRDIERWIARMRGKQDPFLKIGQKNIRSSKGDSDIVYSLNNLNFEIEEGSAVGVIGRNGAGKSTLLKILSRVTLPSTGRINVKGRVASLLEVGTGFHPELTGKENIFLNGAILGMRKHEIQRKLDEIIDFSGVERYIDTPVKRYSSGMYVRLAFAVAAHLESEILIVDEVLAVGDAEFQNKCIGKMSDVSKGEGRTVLFVSHNLNSIRALCNEGIYLNHGLIEYQGKINDVIQQYSDINTDLNIFTNPNNESLIKSIEIRILQDEKSIETFITLNQINHLLFKDLSLEIIIKDNLGNRLLFFGPNVLGLSNKINLKEGDKSIDIKMLLPDLVNGIYTLDIMVVETGKSIIESVTDKINFILEEKKFGGNEFLLSQSHNVGILPITEYEIKKQTV